MTMIRPVGWTAIGRPWARWLPSPPHVRLRLERLLAAAEVSSPCSPFRRCWCSALGSSASFRLSSRSRVSCPSWSTHPWPEQQHVAVRCGPRPNSPFLMTPRPDATSAIRIRSLSTGLSRMCLSGSLRSMRPWLAVNATRRPHLATTSALADGRGPSPPRWPSSQRPMRPRRDALSLHRGMRSSTSRPDRLPPLADSLTACPPEGHLRWAPGL